MTSAGALVATATVATGCGGGFGDLGRVGWVEVARAVDEVLVGVAEPWRV